MRPLPTRSADIELEPVAGSIYHPQVAFRLHIVALALTPTNVGHSDLRLGQVTAEPDDIGTKISVYPNKTLDKQFTAAALGVEALVRTLQHEHWQGPFYAEVPRELQSNQNKIFTAAGFAPNFQLPHRVGRVVLEFIGREELPVGSDDSLLLGADMTANTSMPDMSP